MVSREELAEIKRRADAATPGPWERRKLESGWWVTDSDGGYVADLWQDDFNDAGFIAYAREDIPRLIAEIERLRSIVERIKTAWERNDTTDFEMTMEIRKIIDESE